MTDHPMPPALSEALARGEVHAVWNDMSRQWLYWPSVGPAPTLQEMRDEREGERDA